MKCSTVSFSRHAIERMFERRIAPELVDRILLHGECIDTYTEDKPHPSRLLLGFEAGGPVHVLVAQDQETGDCIVITAYRPDSNIWNDDVRTRRKP